MKNEPVQRTTAVAALMQMVQSKIISLRGKAVIIDADIATLYGVETRRINEAVKNNLDKFPEDYMFRLSPEEVADLRSKISTATISPKSRSLPHAFTEKCGKTTNQNGTLWKCPFRNRNARFGNHGDRIFA